MRILTTFLLALLVAPMASANPYESASPPNDINALESAGLIYSDVQGALPKSLWRGQPRSEITYLLKNLPTTSPNIGIQRLKKRLLLSVTDSTLIENDIPIQNGQDLFTLRLYKLVEMGLFDEAFKLYLKNIKDPENNDRLAEIGVALLLNDRGLAPACLETKAFARRFIYNPFWINLNKICTIKLGAPQSTPIEFPNSPIIQGIFYNKDFSISATMAERLNNLTLLEQLMLVAEKRVDYSNLGSSPESIQYLSPQLVTIFLNDERFPSEFKGKLEESAKNYGIIDSYDIGDSYKKLEENVEKLSQHDTEKLILRKLFIGQFISDKIITKLLQQSQTNPKNYVYIQSLKDIRATNSTIDITQQNYNFGQDSFNPESVNMLKKLKMSLDNSTKINDTSSQVYEKHYFLTSKGVREIDDSNWNQWLKEAQSNQFIGLSLMIVLSKPNNSGKFSQDEAIEVLDSLYTVGLIEQAQIVARNILGSILRLN